MADEFAIKINNLGVVFDHRWILRGLDLTVAIGEKVALSGPSGSGKSTLLKCILGLVVPCEGSIRVCGTPVDRQGVWVARRKLAYVAQEPDLGSGTAAQVVERPFAYKANVALRGNLERIPSLLERFNLPRYLLDKDLSTLSGGEKQRIALISAILLERPIILLDEASSALDEANRRAVAQFFRDADDLTVISVAHDTEGLAVARRVVDLRGIDISGGDHA